MVNGTVPKVSVRVAVMVPVAVLVVLPANVYVNVLASKAVMINVPSYSGCVAPAMATVSLVLARTLAAKPDNASFSATTGKLRLRFKRPSQLYPALELTDTIEVVALVAPDKPGGSDKLMLWLGNPVKTTADEGAGAKLVLSDESSGDEESDQKDDSGSIDALTKELKGQRWDADKSVWK